MRMTIICCPFKTSYGVYASSLKKAIEKKTGGTVQWVGSNCGCGDPIEVGRQFQIPRSQCDYFEMPIYGAYDSKTPWKTRIRFAARNLSLSARGRRYANLSKNAEVIHFQQILNAFGSKALFSWLKQPSNASRIITVHELDPEQLKDPVHNDMYNLADAIIVHCEEMKQDLIRAGVQQEKIHTVLCGTEMPATPTDNAREDIVFYGGHKLMSNKGIDTLFNAMSIIKQKMGKNAPLLKIHGHYGTTIPQPALQLATQFGVTDSIVWLNQISTEDTVSLYQNSLLCVLPYTGSFAGSTAAQAAACQLPIVSTRKAGLPDHLGDAGVWVDQNNPEQLAETIMNLLGDEDLRRHLGSQLSNRARAHLDWDVIAAQTLDIYRQSIHQRNQQLRQSCA